MIEHRFRAIPVRPPTCRTDPSIIDSTAVFLSETFVPPRQSRLLARPWRPLRPVGALVLRSDNGLIFQSRRFDRPVETTDYSRNSSRPIPRRKTGLSSGSFAVSKKSVSGSMCLRRSRRPGGSFGSGSSGTTRSGHIRRSGIEALLSTGFNNQRGWLDFRGALQYFHIDRLY